jgi:tetratricopeptide (TPR) repeat protein
MKIIKPPAFSLSRIPDIFPLHFLPFGLYYIMNLKPSVTCIFILALFLGSPVIIHAQSAFPRVEPETKALEYYRLGARSGYSWAELAEISLWASGDASLSGLEKIKTTVTALNAAIDPALSEKEKAEFILNYMHKNILKNYSLYQTRVDTLLSNGRYNCVSSAVLYVILCKSAGLDTSGVMTKDHAFAMVHINGQDIDVETTNAYGFDPGNRKEFHDSSGRITGFAYVPQRNYRDRQTISQIELVSLILSNRSSDFGRSNNFSAAVPLAVDRAALLLGDSYANAAAPASESIFADPGKDLMDMLFNYGASLLMGSKEEDAIRWAVFASSVYPDSGRWQEFIFAAVNNRISRFIREKKIQDARNFLEAQKTKISEAGYAQLDILVVDADLSVRASNFRTAAEGEGIITAIEQARDGKRLAEKRASELLNFTIQKTAASLCAAPGNDWRAAILYLENALSRYGANREFDQSLRAYKGNLAADYHNRFAAEWNKKNYAAAEQILNEGLAEFPDNRQLLNDKQTIARQNR